MDSKDAPTSTEKPLPFGTISGEDPPASAEPRRPAEQRPAPARDGGSSRSPREREAGDNGAVERGPGGETAAGSAEQARRQREGDHPRRGRRRRGRRGRGQRGGEGTRPQRQERSAEDARPAAGRDEARGEPQAEAARDAAGLFLMDKGGFGVLHRDEAGWISSKDDVFVPRHLIQKHKLRDGAHVEGRVTRGQKHRWQLLEVKQIDGRDPQQVQDLVAFKNLTSIDPDFHYAVGDGTDEVSMRIVDILCPIGRGQRGLIVAPPRTGKTTIMRQFAAGIEKLYPDVHLMVLLVDERPEEATEWQRSVQRGKVFVSTADETAKRHIQVAEAAWMRAMRLVELGEDVIILLDSITRLARAYNNQTGAGGKTMSGGLDSRAMERPRKIFGSARNTETAGSLTIIGTTLIETGSRLDQLVFEEFKGTGNMEMVLARRLADRRIFPAIDIERSGTRKEEKLVGSKRLKRIHTLRRVLARMNWVESMELLITKLDEVEKTDDFLQRFDVDPEA